MTLEEFAQTLSATEYARLLQLLDCDPDDWDEDAELASLLLDGRMH